MTHTKYRTKWSMSTKQTNVGTKRERERERERERLKTNDEA